jgi:hypothetical protein
MLTFFGTLRGDLGPELQAKAESGADSIHVEYMNDGLQNEGWFFRDWQVWQQYEGGRPNAQIPGCATSFTLHTEAGFLSAVEFLKARGYHGGCLLEPLE